MSTRCNIVVNDNAKKNILYCHCDGYPKGVGKQLDYLLLRKISEWSVEALTNQLVKEYIAEFDDYMHHDIDYMYVIDVVDKTLKCYEIDIDNKDYSYEALVKFPQVMDVSYDSDSTTLKAAEKNTSQASNTPEDSKKPDFVQMSDQELEMFATAAAYAVTDNLRERQLIIKAFKQGADMMRQWMLGVFGR